MEIEVFARINGVENITSEETIRVDSARNTVGLVGDSLESTFNQTFGATSTISDVYAGILRNQVNAFLSGTNACLLLVGESNGGIENTLAGPNFKGILATIVEKIFLKINSEIENLNGKLEMPVTLSMFSVQNTELTDLLSDQASKQTLEPKADEGITVKSAVKKVPQTSREARGFLHAGWSFANETRMEPSKSAIIIRLDVVKKLRAEKPRVSRFTIACLPKAENLTERIRNSIHSIVKVVDSLARYPLGNRVIDYEETCVTQILQEELGGNFDTKALFCFNLSSSLNIQRKLLQLSNQLQRCQVFPVNFQYNLQQLIIQYRAAIIYLNNKLKGEPGMEPEDNQLREQVERLRVRLDQMQGSFSSMAQSKGALSAQLIDTEEDKLRASKALVDSHIRNNQLREEMESRKFELTNKVITLEHDLQLMDMERDKSRKEVDNLRRQLKAAEKERTEFAKLRTDYMALVDDHAAEVKKNDTLTMELLNLLNLKTNIASQEDSLRRSSLVKEEGRIRDVVTEMSKRQTTGIARYHASLRQPFSDQDGYKDLYGQLRSQYEENSQKLGDRLETMKKDLLQARAAARERQQELSSQNAQMLLVSGENQELKLINNRLQHKVKDLSEDFRVRLTKYIDDVANFVDREGHLADREEGMAKYVNRMLKDVKMSHRIREDQLSDAAQRYKSRMELIAKDYEKLLTVYGDLRMQVELMGGTSIDVGPDVSSINLSDNELQSLQRKEIVNLQRDVARLKNNGPGLKGDGGSSENWTDIRRQLKELNLSSQRKLEEERSQLLSKNAILEEQLAEHQGYIDKHLAKYKAEIHQLQSQLKRQDHI